ncbi:serine/threonine protein kinase/beta-lactam-binding protein with PASTA domain [Aurantimicrobium minutum]|nr:Stk1 family PASTA domain-containing Ser/Thr kinase [Aurantimicrobium minutum]MDH6424888.1 serine/threonine protein kinase/beta-lactam-binding protein with PASTA domain [Aurantimicrobium minutum]
MTTAAEDPMIGRLIDGRYQVKSRIARGGMATVYLATDLRLERRVAVKIMHGHLADDSAFKARFVQEARSAARLAHPNVVNVFDQGQDSDMAYLVMEYLPGITLRDLLKDYGKLTPEQTVDIMDAVLQGLAAAHESGIVHRDLKPENVLLADDGRIKLGDFGLARATTANTASGQALLGTIAYLSPELLTRGVADARSDIYAIGIMMYEMLTGEQPFKGEQPMAVAYQHANDKVPAPSASNPAIPVELDEIVEWATTRSPDGRPENAGILLDKLLQAEKVIRTGSSYQDLSTQQTMVMPAGMLIGSDDETQAFGTGALAGLNRKVPIDNPVAALKEISSTRRSRGFWIFGITIVLAVLGATAGWFFSSGPGSLATIPATAGMAPADAQKLVEEAGFTAKVVEANDSTVAVGKVIDTDPKGGSTITRGATVKIMVSLGPKIVDTPAFAGMTEADAKKKSQELGFKLKDPAEQFSADVAKGSVIAALDGKGQPLPAKYPVGGEVQFVVSLGAIPPVDGLSVADATKALTDAGLVVGATNEEFSDVAKGTVISLAVPEGVVTKGTNVTLVVSKGPDLVTVPNVVGKSIKDAIAVLQAAGFGFATEVDQELWDAKAVRSQSPAGDSQAKRGAVVTISNR